MVFVPNREALSPRVQDISLVSGSLADGTLAHTASAQNLPSLVGLSTQTVTYKVATVTYSGEAFLP